jgi:hypothetical protein
MFDRAEFKERITKENEVIRIEATNWHLLIYGIAIAQYQMLLEC